jgi:hypothetical protein
MPRPLNSTDNFETIKNWLDGTLTDTNSFTPNPDAIPQVLSNGIYFWFMKPAGYQMLSDYLPIQALPTKYSKEINGELFDLVYIDESYYNQKTITETLNWHIDKFNDAEGINALKKSSPLRQVIGALLSHDLIDGDIQNSVSDFIHKNLIVFWVNDFTCDSTKISSTENTLKLGLKPLFVKPNNTLNEILNDIKDRRDKVYNDTTYKHFGITNGYLKYKYNNENDRIANWIVENRWKCDNIGYKEISLKNTEIKKDMGGKLNEKLNITNNGIIIFKLFKENTKTEEEEKDNKNVIWQSSDLSGWRFTRSRKQDLVGFFENTDSGNGRPKYESIIKKMEKLQKIYFKFYYLND